MRFLCFGAGAIGSYVGGSLQLAGNEVVFVEPAQQKSRIQVRGIQIEDVSGAIHNIPDPEITSDALAVIREQSFDAAILAVKSFDTKELIASLKPVAELLPPFISLQNGVENEKELAEIIGEENVIAVSVCTAISRTPTDCIKVEKLRGIGIEKGKNLSAALYAEFKKAGLKPELIANGTAMKWSKMLSNLLANASSAILDMTPAEIYADDSSFELEMLQIREAAAVMNAYDIPVINIPGVPVKLLVWGIRFLPRPLLKVLLKKQVGSGRGQKMPSFHIDLYAGHHRNEVEFLNGAVVRYADAKKIDVPVNRGYYKILTALAENRLPLDYYRKRPVKLRTNILFLKNVDKEK